ncbi:uncharacterized protein LOC143252487 [Tachypleus tridentatus]|uniref:uncharacterized protein LOC143252487 n=1 Tax=Tachypleus tridentatus TaxID=6853 RepID=UPI003FD0D8AA
MPKSMNAALMKPLVALALPGMYLVYKISEFKKQQQEQNRRKITERELTHLNHKIDKLLVKLEEHEPELAKSREEECAICINAKATMQTFPCGHCVVCRKCFVKTIQTTVSQRLLPLRCVVCRTKILRLKQISHDRSTFLSESRSHQDTDPYSNMSTFSSVRKMLNEPGDLFTPSTILSKYRPNSKPSAYKYKKNKISVAMDPKFPPSTRRIPPLVLAPPDKPVISSLKPAVTNEYQRCSNNNTITRDTSLLSSCKDVEKNHIRPPSSYRRRRQRSLLCQPMDLFPIPEIDELVEVRGSVENSMGTITARGKHVETHLIHKDNVISKYAGQEENKEVAQHKNHQHLIETKINQCQNTRFSKLDEKQKQSTSISGKKPQRVKLSAFQHLQKRSLFKAFKKKTK